MVDKREHILEAAEQLFARFGIKKTTMDDIAKKAHMGKSSLYYYFKSKEEVFEGVIRKDSQLFKNKLTVAVGNGNSPQEKIRNYVVTRMIHLKELSNYYTTLTEEYLDHYTFVENARREFVDYEISTLSSILEDGVNQGLFTIENTEITARNFAICLKGLEYPFFTNNFESDIEKESSQMLNILFKGIEVR